MELTLTGIALRVSLMYLYALVLLRISGKESVSHLTAMDFVVTLIIGDLFDDVFWAEVPVLQGTVGFGTIILAHILVTYASSRNQFLHRLIASPARLVIQKGKLVQENLGREWMRPETLQFEMRLRGEEHVREIKEARLEPKGQVSMLKTASAQPVQKKDLHRFR